MSEKFSIDNYKSLLKHEILECVRIYRNKEDLELRIRSIISKNVDKLAEYYCNVYGRIYTGK